VKAAVPIDRAFCFYYEENIEALEAAGVRVLRYSPLAGDMLPSADIHYLGGGYPELHAHTLAENRDVLDGLRNAAEEGAAIHGECGGMMALCEGMEDMDGRRHRMAGVFPADAVMTKQRQGPSYVDAVTMGDGFRFKAHEFHYSVLRLRKEVPFAYRLLRGSGIDGGRDGMVRGGSIGTYMHRHALSDPGWARRLISIAASR